MISSKAICHRIVTVVIAVVVTLNANAATAVQSEVTSAAGIASPHVTHSEASKHQDVSISLFDPGIPKDASTHRKLGVFPAVRTIEARFLPFVLREILEESDRWGAVRVVPEPSPGDEVSVRGVINKSDGETLEVQLSAIDALGNVWVEGVYAMNSGTSDPNSKLEISSSFRNVFRQFANEMLSARRARTEEILARNREIAMLRYANTLLPAVYGSYLERTEDSMYRLTRLPASNDPMLARIEKIRSFEYQFIDAIDEQYESLYSQTENSYNLWLRYQERLTRYRINGERRRQNREQSDRPGSYNAMRESYEQYKWLKMEEQNLRKWARGFKNEIDPTVVEVEGQVVALDGSLEQRYDEWRRLLTAIFERETTLP